ncbi:hypothetical protein L5L55_10265 [Shewanella glacialipiscicola]|uniref:pPIWI_RE_Z domain-containing protein n=1 Tax=Shewanella glacialipiscicola TaxID=614069 RepID=UPI0021DAF4AC|nr:hypothetical protein [Shewanella glacialipiscicola]MCU7995261.1 hypothetical protein [Shewanella glacialipiscicola]MCU8026604.1 hypothetical protein [Shewanella glacialipiscicola]
MVPKWKGPNVINWLCVFMSHYLGTSCLKMAPLLLSGYRSVASTPQMSGHEEALVNIRRICFHLSNISAIRKCIIRYNEHHASNQTMGSVDRRLFKINEKTLEFEFAFDHPPVEFNDAVQHLAMTYQPSAHSVQFISPGNAKHFIQIKDTNTSFTYEIKGLPKQVAPLHHDLSPPKKDPIKIPVSELRELARQMDDVDKERGYRLGNWENRLKNIICEVPQVGGKFLVTEVITLDEMKHLIGLPGSGKTTLLVCITKWLSEKGFRTVMFFPSIEVCRQYMTTLQRYDVKASLLMGRSRNTRKRHAHQLAESLASGDHLNGFASTLPGAKYFATSCPLPAYTTAFDAGLVPEEVFCEDVLEKNEDSSSRSSAAKMQSRLCPLWSQCGYQLAPRELVEANVWLGHIASADTEVPKHTLTQKMRYFELIARRSDVVIFDEADKVQSHLDEQGIATLSLTGDANSFNADLLNRHRELAAGHNYTLGDPQIFSFYVSTLDFSRCSHLLVNAIQSLDRLQMARYEGSLLTPARILGELISGNNSKKVKVASDRDSLFRKKDALSQLWESAAVHAFINRLGLSEEVIGKNLDVAFIASSLFISKEDVKERHNVLVRAFRIWLSEEHDAGLDDALTEILDTINPYIPEDRVVQKIQQVRLLTAVSFTILGYRKLEPHANALIEQGFIEPLNIDQRCSADLLKHTNDNILGGLSGVRFFSSEGATSGNRAGSKNIRLQYVLFAGSPRAYMYNLHKFKMNAGSNPKVLLTSATSFLEQSPAFHVTKEPDYIVRGLEKKKAVTQSRFVFLPIKASAQGKEYLRYSGETLEKKRKDNLERMVFHLLNNRVVEDAINTFDSGLKKRKAAFVVNSFAQCEQLKMFIDMRFPEWRSKTVALTKDVEKHSGKTGYITASQVEAIGDDDSIELLIFPMGAIGRGVNIVFTNGERPRDAAIGCLFFLTRPHPSVDDLSLLVSIAGRRSEAFNQRNFSSVASLEEVAECLKISRKETYFQIGRLLRNPLMASRLGKLLEPFTANIAVELLQTIGRGMRNGCPVQCFFVDAAWAQMSCHGEKDTPVSSMLVQLIDILTECINHPDPKHAAIYTRLYRSFLDPLVETENLLYSRQSDYEDPTVQENYQPGCFFQEGLE